MKAAVRALFDLPDEAKRRNTGIMACSGYVAPSPANLLYEAFGLFDAAAPADVDAFCASLDVPRHARETVRSYAEAMHELIVDVAGKVAASLGLEGHPFQDWSCQFRINRYNYTHDTVGSSGVQIHTDSGFLTVLQEDDCVGGLEVLDAWTPPPTSSSATPRPPRPRLAPRQHRRRRHGVEQREAAHREAPGAVRAAAHLHRPVPARAQGRQGVRAGGVRRCAAPAPVQAVQLRRLLEAPAVHRRARARSNAGVAYVSGGACLGSSVPLSCSHT